MNDRDVLEKVRDHVRVERADDAALEAIARGESGVPAVADLEARAVEDEAVRAMVAASRPLGDAVEERIARRLHMKDPSDQTAARPQRGRVVAFMRRAGVVVGPLALAAAVLLYVIAGRNPDKSHALLPDYTFVAYGEKEMRGTDDSPPGAPLRLRGAPDAAFEIVVRPATQTAGHVVAYVFAIGEGEPNAVQATVEVAPEGSVRIRGRARSLEGARELRVVLGTASDTITRYEDALSRARDGKSDAQVRVLVIPIVR